jgi:GNAT superfamily N-acetyltransferase
LATFSLLHRPAENVVGRPALTFGHFNGNKIELGTDGTKHGTPHDWCPSYGLARSRPGARSVLAVSVAIELASAHSAGARALIFAATDELARRYGDGADEAELTLDELDAPRGRFFVARVDGHLVGGVGRRTIADPVLRYSEVKRLWIRPDLRRSGLAQALMAHLIDEATTAGVTKLYLETGWAQPEAQNFYVKTGWQRVNDFPEGAFSYPEGFKFVRELKNA